MTYFLPRLASAAICVAAMSFLTLPATAQSGEQKPPDQQSGQPGTSADSGKNGQKTNELAEAGKALAGPAGSPECVVLGRRVVRFLWTDDLDAAFRHLDLYDRFGCPANHIQVAYRCVVLQGGFEGKSADTLNARVHGCWINPAPTNQADTPAATVGNPARR